MTFYNLLNGEEDRQDILAALRSLAHPYALTREEIEAARPVSFAEAGEVLGIIGEEAEGYYQGQKTALEAAEIIQSRVHIYVNED